MLRVLIAEDEDIIRKGLVYTTDWLSMDCVVVAEAANGQEGLEKILECRPDVVIAEKRKKLWEVFKYIDDGKEALKRTEFAKPLIGISKWSDVIPNFKYKEE